MPYRTKTRELLRRRELRARLKEEFPIKYKRLLEKNRARLREYRKNNPLSLEKQREYRQRWIEKHGIEAFRKYQRAKANAYRSQPWIKTYQNIRQRLKRAQSLEKWGNGYRCYVDVKNFLTPADLKMLWHRDNAAQMTKPSIDRKDSDGHYTVDNCQYVEMSVNRAKVRFPGTSKNKLKNI